MKYNVLISALVSHNCVVEIEADSEDQALENASILNLQDLEWESSADSYGYDNVDYSIFED